MGQCQYALKARFPKGKLKRVFPDIMTFWKQGQAAYEWWQNNRNRTEGCYKDGILTSTYMVHFKAVKADFWREFQTQFPLIAEMLKRTKDEGFVDGDLKNQALVMTHDPRNALATHINFGQSDDEPDCSGDILCFTSEVSSTADWTGIANYLKKKYKAKAVKWVSEDDTSLSDFLDV